VQPPLVLEQRPALIDRRPIEQRLERGENDLALDLLRQVRERAARPVKGGGGSSMCELDVGSAEFARAPCRDHRQARTACQQRLTIGKRLVSRLRRGQRGGGEGGAEMGVRGSELRTARDPSDEPAATGLRGGACGGDSCVVGVYVCAALQAVTSAF